MFGITMYTLVVRERLPHFVTVPSYGNAALLTELCVLLRLGVIDEVGIPD
jgi:hypothetical protein